jgi:hypothetical protein
MESHFSGSHKLDKIGGHFKEFGLFFVGFIHPFLPFLLAFSHPLPISTV